MFKIQDIIFLIILIILILFKKSKYTWHAGMISLILAAVFFFIGNLFTSQRLSWYAAAFIAIEIIRISVVKLKH